MYDVRFVFFLRVREAPAECIYVYHHDLYRIADCEIPHLLGIGAVVYKIVVGYIVIQFFKMLLRYLQGFVYPFLDGNTRHHDDEFRESIGPVQLHYSPEIHIGLACTGFHLNIEVIMSCLQNFRLR